MISRFSISLISLSLDVIGGTFELDKLDCGDGTYDLTGSLIAADCAESNV